MAGARLEERKDAGVDPGRPLMSRRASSASHSDHSYSGRAELAFEPSSKMESIRRRTWRWLPAAGDAAEAKARGGRPHYEHGKLKHHKAPQPVARQRNPQAGTGRGRGDGRRGWVDGFRGEEVSGVRLRVADWKAGSFLGRRLRSVEKMVEGGF